MSCRKKSEMLDIAYSKTPKGVNMAKGKCSCGQVMCRMLPRNFKEENTNAI